MPRPPQKLSSASSRPKTTRTTTVQKISLSNAPGPKTPDDIEKIALKLAGMYGPDCDGWSMWPEIVAEHGLTVEQLPGSLLRRVFREAHDRMRRGMLESNADPNRKYNYILVGDAELDPEHNAAHPVHGRAFADALVAEREEQAKLARLNALRAVNGKASLERREPRPKPRPENAPPPMLIAPPRATTARLVISPTVRRITLVKTKGARK